MKSRVAIHLPTVETRVVMAVNYKLATVNRRMACPIKAHATLNARHITHRPLSCNRRTHRLATIASSLPNCVMCVC